MDFPSGDLIALLVVAGFFSAFVDSVVGGGGLISLPALLLTGLPPTMALGTNKMASCMGSLTSSLSFLRSGKIDMKLVKYLFWLSLVGAACGVVTVQQIPSQFLRPLVVVLLIGVSIYTIFRKNWGSENTYRGLTRRMFILSCIVSFSIGFYDGFFGPGAGSFFMFAFLMIGFDFVTAAGNARALNFASNIASVIMFALYGSIAYAYALPMGIAMILGALAGTRLAIRKGAAYVRPLFLSVAAIMIGKQVWDLLH